MKDDNEIDTPLDKWTTLFKEDDPAAPMMTYRLQGLKQQTHYQVEATARNDIGWSSPNSKFVFETAKGKIDTCFTHFGWFREFTPSRLCKYGAAIFFKILM